MKTSTNRVAARAAETLRYDVLPRREIGKVIVAEINRRNINRVEAGALLKEAPSQISRLMTGHYGEFSLERLLKYGVRLGMTAQITLGHPGRPQYVISAKRRVIVESR